MTTVWPAATSSELLLLIVSLQKLYLEPVRVTVLFVPTASSRLPQLPALPFAFTPFQQADALLPLTRSRLKKFELLLLVATSPWFTGGRITGPWPTTVLGTVQFGSWK